MDSIVGNIERVIPHFQPIIAVDTQQIYSYEVLGRFKTDKGIQSLGPFFHNPKISIEEHIFIDRQIRRKAFGKLASETVDTRLFINLNPNWIYNFRNRRSDIPTIQFLREYNIDPSRITVEITEDNFMDNIEELADIVQVYREVGCQIAIDDVGSGFINFDRIAYIKPNILKLDLELVRKCTKESFFKEILTSFSIMAEKIGAFVLFEGIETEEQVQIALSLGARYLQGYYFSRPQGEFQNPFSFSSSLNNHISKYVDYSLWLQHSDQTTSEAINKTIKDCLAGFDDMIIKSKILSVDFLKSVTQKVPQNVKRVYICDERGDQRSPNYCFDNDKWDIDESFIGRNWTWRPYFLDNVVKSLYQEKGNLSTYYTDAHTGEKMRTFIYPINGKLFICLDVTGS
ncbi:EAL domain-containing protein [Heliobacterium mobile]|uniref:EAL domain-containing protein n=1 Tax=Heliobacterium mobile TaxID=28064 RepID=UPI001478D121|nr:EAL domain-containing protein [Heliobacterium mobile]